MLDDGSVARVLELSSGASIDLEPAQAWIAAAPDSESEVQQWYVESRPIARAGLVSGYRLASDGGELAALARADQQSVLRRSPDPATLERSVFVVVRLLPRGRRRRVADDERRSLVRSDELSGELADLGLAPRLLDGPSVSRLLLRRLHSAAQPPVERRVETVGTLDPAHDLEQSAAVAHRLLDHLRGAAIDFADERVVQIGGDLEQTIVLGGLPTDAEPGWLRLLLSITRPFSLALYVHRRPDGLAIAVYQTIREPGPNADPVRLATAVDDVVRGVAANLDVRVDRGEFTQRALWRSTLPLALDAAELTHAADAPAAVAALPLVDGCGSPGGVPLAYGPNGAVERLDLCDVAHRQAAMVVAGIAEPRNLAVQTIATRIASRGATVVGVDLDGALSRDWALGAVVAADAPADALAAGTAPVTLLDARRAAAPVEVLGAAAAALASRTGLDRQAGELDGQVRGALVVAGAERLAAVTGGLEWIARAAGRARRDGVWLVLCTGDLAALAGVLPAVPVRFLFAHDDIDLVRSRLGLSAPEAEALERDADELRAVWLNGERGRAVVHLLETDVKARAA
jgi:hypothetical protein